MDKEDSHSNHCICTYHEIDVCQLLQTNPNPFPKRFLVASKQSSRRCEPHRQCGLALEQSPQGTYNSGRDAKQRHKSTVAGAPRHGWSSSRNLVCQLFDGLRLHHHPSHLRCPHAFAKAPCACWLTFSNFRGQMYLMPSLSRYAVEFPFRTPNVKPAPN